VLEGHGQTLLETDRFSAPLVAQELEKLLFGEDVHLEDLTDQKRVLSLHGPAAAKLLGQVEAQTDTPLSELGDLGVCTGEGLMRPITVFRRDETGALGLHVISDAEPLGPLYLALAEVVGGLNPEVEGGQRRPIAGRGIGWMAYNAARVEAGTPLYRVDYGPDTLPHETGELVHRVVSFNKGCYRGQEVVARMHSLGHPKRVLVGLRLPDQRMPIATAQLLEPDPAVVGRSTGKVVGAVTSSTLSPMLGGVAVCLAMVGWGWHEAGKTVLAPAEGELIPATVGSLRAV
jgi:folate-binding protein YgfZ